VKAEDIAGGGITGLLFVLLFAALMVYFWFSARKKALLPLREIPAFTRLKRAIGLAVEAGKRLHLTLGSGRFNGLEGASAVIGLTILERFARVASVSDEPPVATSGDGVLAILSQDTLRKTYKAIGAESQYDPTYGQLSGLTPYGYAAGTLPMMLDEQVAATFFAGHFGPEMALIADTSERSDGIALAGSDSIPGQTVMYATAHETLIGEELYSAGAYLRAGPMHMASLRAQDVLRWVLILVIVIGAVLKFLKLI